MKPTNLRDDRIVPPKPTTRRCTAEEQHCLSTMSLTEHDNQRESGGASGGTSAPTSQETDAAVRPSLRIRMIRHAESMNNQVYRNARYLFRGGCPDFDLDGWTKYVDAHRQADPSLSDLGVTQSKKLADFLVPHLTNQASDPIRVITSPMRRTLETIRPTLEGLKQVNSSLSNSSPPQTQVIVHGYYFESEGCHIKERAEEGMNPEQILGVLNENTPPEGRGVSPMSVDFVGFPLMDRGWYVHGTTSETREEAEKRASKFYLWLMELLDQELLEAMSSPDVFDAGVAAPGEEAENEHDSFAPRQRRRRTTLLVGHGDFMSLVLKRIVAGFCHAVEQPGLPHRSAFVHYNTGITDLEYFGNGRWLIMSHNATPHLSADECDLRSGGSLKDGWSYLVPNTEFCLNAEVSVAFCDDELEDHVKEQAQALRALYLSSRESERLQTMESDLSVESSGNESSSPSDTDGNSGRVKHFIVKRGMQVVGVATYSDITGLVTDVAVRPSAGKEVSEALFDAVKNHSRKLGRSGSLHVFPRTQQSKALFEDLGFAEVSESGDDRLELDNGWS
jgi:phosphohistidine phosphatase SixA